MFGTDGIDEEKARLLVEGGRVVSGAIPPTAALGMPSQPGPHPSMPLEIVSQPIRHDAYLVKDAHILRQVPADQGRQ